MKKIMFSLLAIVTVASVAGVGSYALWTDVESSEDNTISADHMDLLLASASIDVDNVVPGDNDVSDTIALTNDSNTVIGQLTVSVDATYGDNENGCVEAEFNEGADGTCPLLPDTGAGQGELDEYLDVTVHIDTDADGVADFSSATGRLVDIAGTEIILADDNIDVQPGASVDAWVEYTVVDVDTFPAVPNSNIYMSDDVIFDLDFTLTQDGTI